MTELPRIELQNFGLEEKFALASRNRVDRVFVALENPNFRVGDKFLLKAVLPNLRENINQMLGVHLDRVYSKLEADLGYFSSRLAIPTAVVLKQGSEIGFLMHELTGSATFGRLSFDGSTTRSLRQIEYFFNKENERKKQHVPELPLDAIVAFLADMFETLARLHASNVVVGDISASNLVVQKGESLKFRRRAIFLDVDSFVVEGEGHPLGPEMTPYWQAPEERFGIALPTKASDVYKAALVVRRLLHQAGSTGGASFGLVQSTVADEILERLSGQQLGRLISSAVSANPKARPTSQSIAEAFKAVI